MRSSLVALLARRDLGLKTTAVVAELIAAADRFNHRVAGAKQSAARCDAVAAVDFYEPVTESCVSGLREFEGANDENQLRAVLRIACDALQRAMASLVK